MISLLLSLQSAVWIFCRDKCCTKGRLISDPSGISLVLNVWERLWSAGGIFAVGGVAHATAGCNTAQSDEVTYEECVFVRVSPVFSSSAECWALGMLAGGNTCVNKFHIRDAHLTVWKGQILNKFIFICCYFTHVSGADEHNTVLHSSNSSPKKTSCWSKPVLFIYFSSVEHKDVRAALFRTTQPVQNPPKNP